MRAHDARPPYVAIWLWLLGLTLFCVTLSVIPGAPRLGLVTIFFLVASVKALLVAGNYMHLRFEPRLVHALALVPVAFVVILLVALLPDFVFGR